MELEPSCLTSALFVLLGGVVFEEGLTTPPDAVKCLKLRVGLAGRQTDGLAVQPSLTTSSRKGLRNRLHAVAEIWDGFTEYVQSTSLLFRVLVPGERLKEPVKIDVPTGEDHPDLLSGRLKGAGDKRSNSDRARRLDHNLHPLPDELHRL